MDTSRRNKGQHPDQGDFRGEICTLLPKSTPTPSLPKPHWGVVNLMIPQANHTDELTSAERRPVVPGHLSGGSQICKFKEILNEVRSTSAPLSQVGYRMELPSH